MSCLYGKTTFMYVRFVLPFTPKTLPKQTCACNLHLPSVHVRTINLKHTYYKQQRHDWVITHTEHTVLCYISKCATIHKQLHRDRVRTHTNTLYCVTYQNVPSYTNQLRHDRVSMDTFTNVLPKYAHNKHLWMHTHITHAHHLLAWPYQCNN